MTTTVYFADVMPDGSVRACLSTDAPGVGPPIVQHAEGTPVLLDAPIDWRGPTPSSTLYWDADTGLHWVQTATLEQARAGAWAACKAARDAAEAADFMFEGVAYQPDVQKITGAVLAALLPSATPFSIDWTVSDNSVVTLNASQVIGLGLALTKRINSIHHYGRTMRALIDNAETPDEACGHTWNYQNGE